MLQVQNLTFERGEDRLFTGLNLVVYPGQKVAIVGRNGVGKSTNQHATNPINPYVASSKPDL